MIITINAAWRYWGGRDGGTTQAGDDPTTGGEDFVKICNQVVDLTNCYAKCVNCLWIFQVFIIICFYCTSFDQVLEHFLKHGKTKEEEEEEVKFQEALAQKRLEQV